MPGYYIDNFESIEEKKIKINKMRDSFQKLWKKLLFFLLILDIIMFIIITIPKEIEILSYIFVVLFFLIFILFSVKQILIIKQMNKIMEDELK